MKLTKLFVALGLLVVVSACRFNVDSSGRGGYMPAGEAPGWPGDLTGGPAMPKENVRMANRYKIDAAVAATVIEAFRAAGESRSSEGFEALGFTDGEVMGMLKSGRINTRSMAKFNKLGFSRNAANLLVHDIRSTLPTE